MLDLKGHMNALKRASDSFFSLCFFLLNFPFDIKFFFCHRQNVSVFWACFHSKHWILIFWYLYKNTEWNLKDWFWYHLTCPHTMRNASGQNTTWTLQIEYSGLSIITSRNGWDEPPKVFLYIYFTQRDYISDFSQSIHPNGRNEFTLIEVKRSLKWICQWSGSTQNTFRIQRFEVEFPFQSTKNR